MTALAQNGAGAVVATEKIITTSQAITMVKKVAADELRSAKRTQAAKVAELEKVVGGQVKRVDESVVAQAKALMTRIALIAKRGRESHTNTTQLEGVVKKLGGIVGELEAFMLTNKAAGLFEEVREHEYKGHEAYGMAAKNPLAFAGKRARAAAEAALEGFVIVDDPKSGKKGEKNVTPDASTGRTVAELSASVTDEGEDLEDDEFEDGDEE
jgi:hypothetical protein